MDNDLIERLREFLKLAEVAEHQPAAYLKPDKRHIDDLREAIAALSPVLPEDVSAAVVRRRLAQDNETADLIERLARNCKTIEESRDYWMREAEGLQQRIEELTAPVLPEDMQEIVSECRRLQAHRDEYHGDEKLTHEGRAADLIERLARQYEIAHQSQNNAWLRYEAQGEEGLQMEQRIEELEDRLTLSKDQTNLAIAQIAEYEKALSKIRWDFNQQNFSCLGEAQDFAANELERIRKL